jgi:hypothetical protein
MQLVAMTLVPMSPDRPRLTPETLRDILMDLRDPTDRIEHIQVIERAGLLWIGAYVATPEAVAAQQSLSVLCGRLGAIVHGWAVISGPPNDD